MKKRLVSILCVLALCLTLLPVTALATGEKEQYRDHPLFVDLNLDDNLTNDDENFVVMQRGAVILGPDDGMSIDASDDGSEYVLRNPSQAAMAITAGTPVAFVDKQNEMAYFFLPTQVSPAADAITFSCDPANTAPEDLFETFYYEYSKPFTQHIVYDKVGLEFDFVGSSDLVFSLTPDGIDVDWTVGYALENAVFESDGGVDHQDPARKVPIIGVTGMEIALQTEFTLSAADASHISFDLEGGKTGIQADGPLSQEISFTDVAEAPTLNVNEIASEGDFEIGINICPIGNLSHMMEFGCNMTEQISVAAQLTGNEGQNEAGQPWHTCKRLSCLDGTVERSSTSAAYIHTAQKEHDQEQTVSTSSTPFYYSFTFDAFGWDASCPHLLYPVEVTVLDADDQPIAGADVRYSPDRNFTPGTIDYCTAVTDDDGLATLYLPEGKAYTITASIQQSAGASGNDEATVQSAVDCTVSSGSLQARAEIRMPSSEKLRLVTFDDNAGGEPVENMPGAIFLEREGGTLPNEVPQREGYFFTGWATAPNDVVAYLPGGSIQCSENSKTLYAKWAQDSLGDEFRIVAYDPNGNDVILADNPQIYSKDSQFTLRNPVRKGYFFTGWTCREIEMVDPQMEAVVSWNGEDGIQSDYISRTYVANWEQVKYNVIWRNWDGSCLNVTRDVYDELPAYSGSTPTRAPDDQNYYVFAGWTPEIQVVTEDAEYAAVYHAYDRLKFLASPQDVTLKAGETAVFRAETAGGAGDIAYQWYQIPSGAGAEDAQPISGATSATLTLTADDSMNGNRYYCVATDTVGQQIISEEASLVIPAPQQGGGTSTYATTVESTSNGAVTVSPRNASKGSTVTVTVKPDDGYALDTLTVTDKDGNALELTRVSDTEYTFTMPAGAVTVDAVFAPVSLPFTDVAETAWYYDAVRYAHVNGLMEGTSDTTFTPNGTTTRAMVVTILWRQAGEPVVNYAMDFADVAEGTWYAEAVRWAASEGIADGYGDGGFGTNDPITREQFAVMLWRFARQQGYDVSVGEDTNILSYTDALEISEYAIPAMQWACGAGILEGNAGHLYPQGDATRAEVATMLMRFCGYCADTE